MMLVHLYHVASDEVRWTCLFPWCVVLLPLIMQLHLCHLVHLMASVSVYLHCWLLNHFAGKVRVILRFTVRNFVVAQGSIDPELFSFCGCRYQKQMKLPSQPKGIAADQSLTVVACVGEVLLWWHWRLFLLSGFLLNFFIALVNFTLMFLSWTSDFQTEWH